MLTFSRLIQFVLTGALALAITPALQAGSRGIQAAPGVQPQAAAESCNPARSVNVTGTALVNVTPDRALVRLGVQSNASSIDAVENANSAAIQKVIQAVIARGVEAKDISTDIYVVEPVYENYASLFIKGYRITNEVAVTLRDVQQTSGVISAALKAGANQVNNVEFYTSELRKYRDQARDLAVTAANEKAQALAQAAGADTDCVITINENTWSYYNGWWYGRNQNLWTQNTVQNASSGEGAAPAGDEPISLGQISVKAEVSITYSLK